MSWSEFPTWYTDKLILVASYSCGILRERPRGHFQQYITRLIQSDTDRDPMYLCYYSSLELDVLELKRIKIFKSNLNLNLNLLMI